MAAADSRRYARALAEAVLVTHGIISALAIFGGFLLFLDARWAWIHVPLAAWVVMVNLAGWTCPLTPLEKRLRAQSGAAVYEGDFVEHYLGRHLWPRATHRQVEVATGITVLVVNALIYAFAFMPTAHAETPDIESYWEYSDPAASEARFRAALASASGDLRLELLTQVARTLGLRKRFEEAHRILDEVEPQLAHAGVRTNLRYLLERGRAFNSAGDKERARKLFEAAWEKGREAGVEGLAVDAAHMVAITYSGSAPALDWNRRGLDVARASTDSKARALIPAMLNNSAWDLQDMGRSAEALPLFNEALAEWSARDKPRQVQFARWSVARCLRSLGRFEEALAIQRGLEAEHAAAGSTDKSVFEEIAANLEAMGKRDEARRYVDKAKAAP